MGDETDTPRPRASRFKEHTNTANSIKPPPDELWKDLGIEDMIDKFNEESNAPPKPKGKPMPPAVLSTTPRGPRTSAPAVTEGTLGRFSRAFASVFSGFGSVLGKRKASQADLEKEKERQVLEDRKLAADQAYQAHKLAQEQGLLPTPKVFVRPNAMSRSQNHGSEHATLASTPRTPTLYRTPSKKDLHKQKKLTKRVSDLESKLASARKELQSVLHPDVPPIPQIPAVLPPTPSTDESQMSQCLSEGDKQTSQDTQVTSPNSQQPIGKIVKKRKATDNDDEANFKPVPTDSDGDLEMTSASEHGQRTIKRIKSSASGRKPKRNPSRLTKRRINQSGS